MQQVVIVTMTVNWEAFVINIQILVLFLNVYRILCIFEIVPALVVLATVSTLKTFYMAKSVVALIQIVVILSHIVTLEEHVF